MLVPLIALIAGLIVLVWSADRFVEGSASLASYFGMPPLMIGMVIVGFGTSAPEMVVSTLASFQGNPGIALGNAYGSNIANIALILGVTAIISPIYVKSTILKKELPILTVITAISAWLISDFSISFIDAVVLLLLFTGLMSWTIIQGLNNKKDALTKDMEEEIPSEKEPLNKSVINLIIGLVLLIGSSRLLVWGAVEVAQAFGVTDMIIGLTIVAIGTSLPELASSIIAAKKGEHELALGNVIGSNLFNTLGVVGLAGIIHPFPVEAATMHRDMILMGALTLSLFIICYGFRGRPGRINRFEGAFLLTVYISYSAYLAYVMISI